ncbi:MAG: hypothetical protein B6D41_14360 [Chloroflexi bacterium UTCFX4]|jgi:5-methylcytosine-specific restriction endonuclease McrBC regulatory subunit McrC|nr:MAG: hypothetical protein B6D41_14360 [Chloroflexi bacterium UTCFX4]
MEYFSIVECRREPITVDWFTPDMLTPNHQKYFSIERDATTRHWVIQAESYVGIVPLTREYGVQIRPKSGLKNLTYMLYRSGLLTRSLETPFTETVPYEIPNDDLETFFEGLIQNFLESIDAIKRWGLMRFSKREYEYAYAVRGKVDYLRWVRALPQTGGLPIPQEVFVSEFDNLPNRVLQRCLEYLALTSLKYVKLGDILERLDYFAQVPSSFVSQDELNHLERDLTHGRFPSNRYYYLPALNLAFLIFRGAGLGLGDKQDITFKPILINTADMFEKYIRALMQEKVKKYDARAEDGKQNPTKFYAQAPQPIYVQPDILIRYGGSVVSVGDVKYKFAPTPQDHYQMWAYMQAYLVKQGGFISLRDVQSTSNKNPAWFKREEYAVFDFAFDCTNIKLSEEQLGELTESLVSSFLA